MINQILNSGIVLSGGSTGGLAFKGPSEVVTELKPFMSQWKPELLKIVLSESIGGVGQCKFCESDLIGFPVAFDGYTNRVCPDCGKWHICLPPEWTPEDLDELIEERAAIMQHDGNANADEVEILAQRTVEHQLSEQRIELRRRASERINNKDGRQSGRTDDRDNQLKRS